MRLFVAVELDGEAQRAIGGEQMRIAQAIGRANDGAIKWIRPDRMHLTLVFLGQVAESQASSVVDAMRADIGTPSFTLAFGGLGVFPPRGAPRVLWLGVRDGETRVAAVQREVAIRAARIGIRLETRPFHPHLTLARWRWSRPSDARAALAAGRGDVVAGVRVDRVTLMESRLSPAGPTYIPRSHARLTA